MYHLKERVRNDPLKLNSQLLFPLETQYTTPPSGCTRTLTICHLIQKNSFPDNIYYE